MYTYAIPDDHLLIPETVIMEKMTGNDIEIRKDRSELKRNSKKDRSSTSLKKELGARLALKDGNKKETNIAGNYDDQPTVMYDQFNSEAISGSPVPNQQPSHKAITIPNGWSRILEKGAITYIRYVLM